MQKQYLEAGKIVAPVGLRGEVKVQPWTDSPQFFFSLNELYLDGAGKRRVAVERARQQKNMVVLKLKGTDDVDQANLMRNQVLWVDRKDIQLPAHTYFIQDLIGMRVVDVRDEQLIYGTLVEVSPTGANDVYHVEKNGRMFLIPAIPQVIAQTDVKNGILRIYPLEGLFDDAD